MGNRFDALRLAASLGVFFSHGLFLYQLQLPVPFPGHSLGSLSVYVFFFISGYLVCQSWMRESTWRAFAVKRSVRIFPGLVVAVAFYVFVLGGAVTTLPAVEYWHTPETWLNFVNNAAGIATVQTLPGVFESNPFARAVNGSLWTIRYELCMYLVMVLLAMSARGTRWVYPVAAAVLAALWLVARLWRWDAWLELAGTRWSELFRWRDFCGFGVPFFLGSTFAAYALRPRWWMALVAFVAAMLAYNTSMESLRQLAVWALIAFGVFYAAHAGAAAVHGRGRMDISYGIYIYAFPVQQAVTELSVRHGWSLVACMLISLAVVLVLALISWLFVERPCIEAAQRWRHRGG